MAQLVEHNLAKVGVAGSSPVVRSIWAFSSGGERFPDTEEVTSSNLVTPTKCSQLRGFASELFCFTPASHEGDSVPKATSTTPATTPAKREAASALPAIAPTGPKVTSKAPPITPDKPKTAQTALAAASIRPRWVPQPLLNNHPKSKVNGFPRSERAKTGPRSIDTFGGPFPAVLLLESCGFGFKKCGCFGGPNKLAHFSGKPFTLILAAIPPVAKEPPYQY